MFDQDLNIWFWQWKLNCNGRQYK